MKIYWEKYALGMLMVVAIVVHNNTTSIPISEMNWKHYFAVIMVVPGMVYFLLRINDTHSDIDSPFFTWKKFWLFFSLMLGFVVNLEAAILLGYI